MRTGRDGADLGMFMRCIESGWADVAARPACSDEAMASLT